MKRYLRFFQWMMILVAALLPVLCFAADPAASDSTFAVGGSSPLWDMFKNLTFTPAADDMSVGYLVKIFGTVPGVPQFAGAGITIIGVVFTVFNSGILALSGIFLSYTVTRVLTETTMDGAAIGKSTTIWTAVRCSLSTGLLVPQASGYSMINGIVMWVVIQSIGLANSTWGNAMDYLKTGGPVYTPHTARMDYSLINFDEYAGDPKIDDSNKVESVGATDVLRSLTCAHIVHKAVVSSQDARNKALFEKMMRGETLTANENIDYANSSKIISGTSAPFYIHKYLDDDGFAKFPYVENEVDNPLLDYGLNLDYVHIPTNLSGICGTIKYNDSRKIYKDSKAAGLSSMISILEPTAKQLVERIRLDKDDTRYLDPNTFLVSGTKDSSDAETFFISGGGGDSEKYSQDNLTSSAYKRDPDSLSLQNIHWPFGADPILSAAAQYQVALEVAQRGGEDALSKDKQKKFDDAKKHGWIAAGNYYRLLSGMQDQVDKEYDSYRLLNGDTPSSRHPIYQILFSQAVTNQQNSSKTAIATLDESYAGTLDKSLKWIFLAYPYSKLHGELLTSGISDTRTGEISLGKEGDMIQKGVSILTQLIGTNIVMARALLGVFQFVTKPPLGIAILTPIPAMFLVGDMVDILGSWVSNMVVAAELDPIIRIQNLGTTMMGAAINYMKQIMTLFQMINVAISSATMGLSAVEFAIAGGSFWGTMLGASTAISVLISIYNSLIDVGQTLIFMTLPIGMSMMGTMFISGVIFSVYVPLVPYLLFMFGALSWLISVLVLMAAAPIICFLMLWGTGGQTSENPMLAKEAEQFVMQVIGVFFRPTLMVIGLIVGMILSYIGIDLLNMGFNKVIAIVMQFPEEISVGSMSAFVGKMISSEATLIKLVGVLVVYTFAMVSIINMCFSTIYLLYSEVMKVAGISAPAVGMEQDQLEGVKGGVSQLADAGASGGKETAGTQKGANLRYKGGG